MFYFSKVNKASSKRKVVPVAYTVKELAQISGVSVRTLHFYDEIGLLKPAWCGDNGYRYYEEEQLLLLQQILFYRELGFELKQIQDLLRQSDFDKVEALKSHKKLLLQNKKRMLELLQTVDKTIDKLTRRVTMQDKELFAGFDNKQQKHYDQHVIDRYGSDAKQAIAQRNTTMSKLTPAELAQYNKAYDDLMQEIMQVFKKGLATSSPAVQELVRKHYEWEKLFWLPDCDSYKAQAKMTVEYPYLREYFENLQVGLAQFLAEAMVLFADHELK